MTHPHFVQLVSAMSETVFRTSGVFAFFPFVAIRGTTFPSLLVKNPNGFSCGILFLFLHLSGGAGREGKVQDLPHRVEISEHNTWGVVLRG